MKTKRLFTLILCAALAATCVPALGDELPAVTDIPAITEIPASTDVPTATEIPAITEAPAATEMPVATDTPIITEIPVISAAPAVAEAPLLFENGYALLTRDTAVYKTMGGAVLARLTGGSAVYVSARVPSGTGDAGDDWLLCQFALETGALAGYIPAKYLSPVAAGETAALEQKIAAAGSVFSYAGHPLTVLEIVSGGAATPVPAAGPTEKPTFTAKPLPPGKIVSTGTTGSHISKSALIVKSALDGYPESGHPYANDMDSYYYYVKNGSSGYIITFSSETETEAGFDYLSFYNSAMTQLSFTISGETYSSFTGTQLAGRSLYITSPSFFIRLKTDSSIIRYGFSFSNITPTYPVAESPTIYLLEQATETSVSLRWDYVSSALYGFADGFQIYRATTSGGTYTYVKSVTGTTAIDTGLAAGASRWYKVRAYFQEAGGTVYGAFSASKGVVVMAKPIITTIQQSGQVSSYIAWGAVTGADAYMLYRSATSAGTYLYLKTVTSPSATDSGLATGATYYYKVRPLRFYGARQVDGVQSAYAGIGIMAKPVITSVAQTSSHTVKVRWNTVTWASGYMLYRSNASAGIYTYIKSVTTLYAYDYSVPVGTWYYKIVPYRMNGTAKMPGAYSNPVGKYVSY
jgi:hypothetical protein